ncbi:hypothetical protein OAF34_01295 [Pirellulaceae bacterium]|nr:hypothetical protein [Pirellulaceae bacterium]
MLKKCGMMICLMTLIGCGKAGDTSQDRPDLSDDAVSQKATGPPSRKANVPPSRKAPRTKPLPERTAPAKTAKKPKPAPEKQSKKLTLEIVQLFLRGEKHQGKQINTASYSTIEDAAAAELTKHDKPVFLNGLVEISEPAAQSLAQIQSNLALGLVDLSPPVAAELAKHKGFLSFNRLSDVSDSVAEKLGQHQGGLFLSGLTELTETASEGLAKSTGVLALNGLTKLTDRQAEFFSMHKGDLHLNGLTKLTDRQAEFFSRHKGDLNLNGLSALTASQATDLGQTEGGLMLKGIVALPEEVAAGLCQHPQTAGGSVVVLDGVTSLSDQAAVHFESIQCTFYLMGLVDFSDRAAQSLSKKKTLIQIQDQLRYRLKGK